MNPNNIDKTNEYLISNISTLLYFNHWTIRDLANKSDVPYETLKKLINGKIAKPSLQNIIKLARAFDCSVDTLISYKRMDELENKYIFEQSNFQQLPDRAFNLISTIARFEGHLAKQNKKDNTCFVPVLIATGHMVDGMIYDSVYAEHIDISGYDQQIRNNTMCCIKITNQSFHPTYLENDILLIARDRHPIDGETGVFLSNGRIYIRKFQTGSPSMLLPVNGIGSEILFDNIGAWFVFGRILTIMRTSKDHTEHSVV